MLADVAGKKANCEILVGRILEDIFGIFKMTTQILVRLQALPVQVELFQLRQFAQVFHH